MLRLSAKVLLLLLGVVIFGITAGAAAAADYQVFAANDLGMHCMDSDFSVFSILPPGNSINAQVILKPATPGGNPRLLTNADVRLTYKGMLDPSRSINTTSIRKTNFWTYVNRLFGVTLAADTGFLGAKMPGRGNTPQPFASFDAGLKRFNVVGIPITDRNDMLKINNYSLMNIQALNGNTPVSSLPVVVPVSAEMICSQCHATGMDAASPGFHGVTAWSANRNQDLQTRENILILHDAINGTRLLANKPVLCASCHYSLATDFLTHGAINGPDPTQATHKALSPAMHLHHGSVQGVKAPIPDRGIAACYACHPGEKTRCFRGSMARAGLICQDCHGSLLSVGGAFPLQSTGQPRRPWLDLPQCQSCHTGDAAVHAGDSLTLRKAYDPTDKSATPRVAANQRFAENANNLFRFSAEHGGVACNSCHGSPHAEWAASKDNDNLAAIQIQGYAGVIRECTPCHGDGLSPTMNGPHGLHNVNDPGWMGQHGTFYNNNPDSCKTCHGLMLEGTSLSRTGTARSFDAGEFTIKFAAGQPVGCANCHDSPLMTQ